MANGDRQENPEWLPVESVFGEGERYRAEIQKRPADGMFRFIVSRSVWTRSDDHAWSPVQFSGLYDTASAARHDALSFLKAEAARDLRRSGELESSVKDVLWQRWDPIGVNDVPEAYGEYDSYAGPIATLIRRGATEQELREHLEAITADRMGIKNAAAAAAAAASLARLTRS